MKCILKKHRILSLVLNHAFEKFANVIHLEKHTYMITVMIGTITLVLLQFAYPVVLILGYRKAPS